jgi:hypothetical protein
MTHQNNKVVVVHMDVRKLKGKPDTNLSSFIQQGETRETKSRKQLWMRMGRRSRLVASLR